MLTISIRNSVPSWNIKELPGRIAFKCQMCDKVTTIQYDYTALLTKIKMRICKRCAQRESGKKYW